MRAFLLLILLSGCELSLDIDVPQAERVLVIDAPFEVGQPWRVGVGHSMAVQQGRLQDHDTAVFGATVEIYEGDTLVERLVQDRDPIYPPRPVLAPATTSTQNYRGTTMPIAGRTYTLVVRHPDFPNITATDTAPIAPGPLVFGGSTETRETQSRGTYVVEAQLSLSDGSGASFFYALELLRRAAERAPGTPLFPNSRKELDLSFLSKSPVLLRSANTVFGTSGESTFDTGFFSGRSLERSGGGLRTRAFTSLVQECYGTRESCVPMETFARLYTVSTLYFDYVRSALAYQSMENNENPISEPVRLASNVEGGLGLFAGRSAPILVELAERP